MRWIAALAAAFILGCASIGAPPGGPPRTTPPEILQIAPESGAVNVRARSIVFTFDAVLNDRGDLDKLFLLSPQERGTGGRPRVSWHRERIEIRPRRGFQPNTAYSVTVLPGLADLRGNVTKTGRTVVFSTGPSIPPFLVFGRVFDWSNERTVPRALVEVIRRPDSLRFLGVTDTTGQFGVGPVGNGTYTVRAIIDANNNRGLDPGESWDSVTVVIGGGTSPFVELLAVQRDTIPPRLLTVSMPDTVTLVVTFDRPLDPTQKVGPGSFRVVGADSAPLRIVSVRTRAQVDSARDSTARADSAARADSIARAARTDTTVRRDTTRRAPPPAAAPPRRDTSRLGGPVVVPPPKPSKPPPPRDLTIRLDSLTPLQYGKQYRVTALNVKGLLGPPATTERVITVPRRAPTDTTRRAPGDTARRVPTVPPVTAPPRRPP